MARKAKKPMAFKTLLPNDFGPDFSVQGTILGEEMFFDEATGSLTVEKLIAGNEETSFYSIVTASGHERTRAAYKVVENDDNTCIAGNGTADLEVGQDDLILLLAMKLAEETTTNQTQLTEQVNRLLAVNES